MTNQTKKQPGRSQNVTVLGKMQVVLSLFPNVGLLDMAFEQIGFCVIRGPDILWGGDIEKFHFPQDKKGLIDGVIGGPPCQEFSKKRRIPPTGYGVRMLNHFVRLVVEIEPEWFLMENVQGVPNVTLPGYVTQRLDVNNAWFDGATSQRERIIQFGSKSGRLLNIPSGKRNGALPGAALANDNRSFDELKRLQGLPTNWDLPPFTVSAKKRAVGNGVPLPMGRALAGEILRIYGNEPPPLQMDIFGDLRPFGSCLCGCGRIQPAMSDACRKRLQRKRDRFGHKGV